MKLYTPQYYHLFSCIAADCPDSCCKGWAVDVDDDVAAFYRNLPGDLGDRLRSVLRNDGDGAYMQIENGRCPMWRNDGLCRIQAELGHDALCHVCRTFPRLRHVYGDFTELGLELSCPEAARLILDEASEMICLEIPGGEEIIYDQEVMATLLRSRAEILSFLQSDDYTVPQQLAILLLYAHGVQAELDGGEEAILSPVEDLAEATRYATGGSLDRLLDFFRDLEVLDPAWPDRLSRPAPSHWTSQYRALARYFIMRYWLQAVSDYDLISRAKLTVSACLVIHTLGGDLIQTAQAFSKEIENDPDNVERILDGAYTSPALTDTQLLSLLLRSDL